MEQGIVMKKEIVMKRERDMEEKGRVRGKRAVLWLLIALMAMPAGDVHGGNGGICATSGSLDGEMSAEDPDAITGSDREGPDRAGEGVQDTSAPTDLHGNVIDWDMDGAGDEDAAGGESDADRMEAPTYGTEEQAGILSHLTETTAPAERGYLHIECDLGEEWPGYNVTLALYDGRNKRQDVTVYRQNGYEASELLPAGIYKVYRAYVPGDGYGDLYPLVVSESQVTVGEGIPTGLVIWRAEAIERKGGARETEGQKETGDGARSAVTDAVMTAAVIIGIILLIIGIATAIRRWMDHRCGR